MQRILWILGAGALCAPAFAQEVGTVISAQPVVQQVAVPRQVCTTQQQAAVAAPSGAGAVIGAIAGGLLGSAFGGGSGQALATAVGVVGGAVAGNQVESRPQVQTVQNCTTQTFYENRAVYYDVVYEYAGKRYTVQMPNDPGPTVQLQVTPVNNVPPPPPVQAPARIISSTTYVQPALEQVTVLPPTMVYQSSPVVTSTYAAPSFVAPLAIGIGIGYMGGHFSRGHYHYAPPRHGHRPHWRR